MRALEKTISAKGLRVVKNSKGDRAKHAMRDEARDTERDKVGDEYHNKNRAK